MCVFRSLTCTRFLIANYIQLFTYIDLSFFASFSFALTSFALRFHACRRTQSHYSAYESANRETKRKETKYEKKKMKHVCPRSINDTEAEFKLNARGYKMYKKKKGGNSGPRKIRGK